MKTVKVSYTKRYYKTIILDVEVPDNVDEAQYIEEQQANWDMVDGEELCFEDSETYIHENWGEI